MEVDTSTLRDLGKWILGGLGVLSMGVVNLLFKRADNVDRRLNSLEESRTLHTEAMRRIDENIAAMRNDMQKLTAVVITFAHDGKS